MGGGGVGRWRLDGNPGSTVIYPGLLTSPGPCLDLSQPLRWNLRRSGGLAQSLMPPKTFAVISDSDSK